MALTKKKRWSYTELGAPLRGWFETRAIGVTRNLYHNLYHRPPALASAHQRVIGEIPLISAPTSARLISDKREVGSSSLPRPIFLSASPVRSYGLRGFAVSRKAGGL